MKSSTLTAPSQPTSSEGPKRTYESPKNTPLSSSMKSADLKTSPKDPMAEMIAEGVGASVQGEMRPGEESLYGWVTRDPSPKTAREPSPAARAAARIQGRDVNAPAEPQATAKWYELDAVAKYRDLVCLIGFASVVVGIAMFEWRVALIIGGGSMFYLGTKMQ